MIWHIIDGAEGCDFAAKNGFAAIIVDALRASATAAMLFEHGASELRVVRDVDEAYAAKKADPDALLFGERGGLPPAGFDRGNSPREVSIARGRRVVFTTTNGAKCLVAAKGAPLVLFATTTNATAAAQFVRTRAKGAVLIPAGLEGAPKDAASEDRAAAAYIARVAGAEIGEGGDVFSAFAPYLTEKGLREVFQSAPHAAAMRSVGLDADIDFCAQVDLTKSVPWVTRYEGRQAIMRDGRFLSTDYTD